MEDPPTDNISITNDYTGTHTHTPAKSGLKTQEMEPLGVRSLPLPLYPKLIVKWHN